MASRKHNRTSKTDHVLSLLSGGEGVRPAGQAGDPASPPPAAAQEIPAPAAPARSQPEHLGAPILQVARTNNEALSSTIRDALSQSLEESLAQEAGARPAPTEAPAAEEAPATEEAPAAEGAPALDETLAPEPQPEPEPEPETPFSPRETRLPDGSVCLNVMELLVDERQERYVRMFGLCSCPRCLADVRALALTRLPAKYVVMPAGAAAPLTSLYRARYETDVIAQVIQACKTVMESPRHQLDGQEPQK